MYIFHFTLFQNFRFFLTNSSTHSGVDESQTLSASQAAALPLPGSPALCSTLNDSGCESSEGVPVGQKIALSTSLLKESNADVVIPAPRPPPPLPVFTASSTRESVAELIKKVCVT